MAAAALAGLAVTVAVVVVPDLRFAYSNPSLHVAIETGAGVVALLLAYVAAGRYRLSRSLGDVLVATTFGLLGLTGLAVSVAPAVALETRPVGYATWLAVGLRLLAALTIWAAAMVGRSRRLQRDQSGWWALAVGGGVLVVVVLAAVADGWLSTGLDPDLSPVSSGRPRLVGHPLILGVQLVAGVLWAWAGVSFWRRRHEGPLFSWLAAGSVLSAVARLNYFLYPSLYSQWVYTGDFIRLGAYGLFLVGAAREIDSWVRVQAGAAREAERRRVARELHDGLAQELSFIRSQVTSARVADEMLPYLAQAADRALVESRRLVGALSDTSAEATAGALRSAAADVVERAGVTLRCEVDDLGLEPGALDALCGVVREASANAVAHGEATRVTVRLSRIEANGCLSVADDGVGFDPSVPAAGFGLRSMEERAALLGGRLSVHSSPGRGTTVEVRFSLEGVR